MAPLTRSLRYYYGDAGREAAMDAMYRRFVRPGDVVFDIGAHVGDRVACFRRLGARVVAVEPQPLCMRALRALYAHDDRVALVEAACGPAGGSVPLYINSANPTVSTNSVRFLTAATGSRGWENEVWDQQITVPAVTLDTLVQRFGLPAFIKIDVEGYEDAVLAGLSRGVRALSFEFTTIARDVARRCLDRAGELGFDGFDVSLGETMARTFGRWAARDEMLAHLAGLPHEANAGDVYAVSRSAGWPDRREDRR
uniref:Methyltransferase n=1 Tax=Actinoplanes garbadinensis TaxID=69485 RepID=C4NFI9_ACTGA|nr:methyltransferase [Actinoplanes garbadinensis]